MAKFLNTSATNYFLEELIKDAHDRLILISPFLKLNDRMKELLADKNRLKIDVRIVYGKSELQPAEIAWLKELTYIRTSFCKNLHAKCYMNEELCIVTSLNLYEFSQVNNNEMGVLMRRSDDPELYRDAYDEAQRIIRISEEIRISMERVASPLDVAPAPVASAAPAPAPAPAVRAPAVVAPAGEAESAGDGPDTAGKITTAKLAARLGLKSSDFQVKLTAAGYLETRYGKPFLTAKGHQAGGEFRKGSRFGPYFLWPEGFKL